jgi:hypothetical protein
MVNSVESSLSIQIKCDEMDLTADIVQDMAKFFKINELQSTVNFPQEMIIFEEVCLVIFDRLKDIAFFYLFLNAYIFI